MTTETITATVLISNSDNKLTQNEWAHFVEAMNQAIREVCIRVHFFGGAHPFDPWQNACWVVEIKVEVRDALDSRIRRARESYRQDSAAVIYGETKFI